VESDTITPLTSSLLASAVFELESFSFLLSHSGPVLHLGLDPCWLETQDFGGAGINITKPPWDWIPCFFLVPFFFFFFAVSKHLLGLY
jgi:hypothetical protein